jgi:hypothetical protein
MLQAQALIAELAFGELEFAGHARHTVAFVAFVIVEYVPAAQSTHAALPVTFLYLPATQATHGPPSGPVEPGLHATETHALTLELPLGEVVPAGHVRQVVILLYTTTTIPEPPLPPIPKSPNKPLAPPPPPVLSIPLTPLLAPTEEIPPCPPPPVPPVPAVPL